MIANDLMRFIWWTLNTILTQFDGPVTFNKLVKVNEDLTVNGIMKLNNSLDLSVINFGVQNISTIDIIVLFSLLKTSIFMLYIKYTI